MYSSDTAETFKNSKLSLRGIIKVRATNEGISAENLKADAEMKSIFFGILFAALATNVVVDGHLRARKLSPRFELVKNYNEKDIQSRRKLLINMKEMKKDASKHFDLGGIINIPWGALYSGIGAHGIDPESLVKDLPLNLERGN